MEIGTEAPGRNELEGVKGLDRLMDDSESTLAMKRRELPKLKVQNRHVKHSYARTRQLHRTKAVHWALVVYKPRFREESR